MPYWSGILKKNNLKAHQLSKRGGLLVCENKGSRVIIGGAANVFLRENINF